MKPLKLHLVSSLILDKDEHSDFGHICWTPNRTYL